MEKWVSGKLRQHRPRDHVKDLAVEALTDTDGDGSLVVQVHRCQLTGRMPSAPKNCR